MSQALHCTPNLAPRTVDRAWALLVAGFPTQPHNLVPEAFDLVGHPNQTVARPRNIGFHVRHHFPMTPARPAHWGIPRDAWAGHGEERTDESPAREPIAAARFAGQTVHRRRRVRRQTERSFEVGVRHVHQDGLSHVVEVVAQRNDVSAHPLRCR